MDRIGDFLTRHRNLFLAALLVTTLFVSSTSNIRRLSSAQDVTALPVTAVHKPAGNAIAVFSAQRDSTHLQDITALEALCLQEDLDAETRRQAAEQMQEMIRCREAQAAIEKALVSSNLAPCAAVVSGGSLTIVTEQPSFTEEDAALVMILADAHAGIAPADVRIMTAE